MNENDFSTAKVGDRVFDVVMGWGKITKTDNLPEFPILVTFPAGDRKSYDNSGYHEKCDKNPTLFWDEVVITPPPRPKRKVTKTLEGWVNVYSNSTSCIYHDENEADIYACLSRTACVHVTGTYEVEE